MSMLSSSLNSYIKRECQAPRRVPKQQRREAGYTNRWRLARPMASDLLGQAQMQRATRPSASLSHRTAKSANSFSACDDAASQDPLPPQTAVAPDAAKLPTEACHSREIPQSQQSPEHSFYVFSQQVVQNAKPDAVLECLGSLWELHCPFLSRSRTLAKLYINGKKQRDTRLQDRSDSCGRTERCGAQDGVEGGASGGARRWEQRTREYREVVKNRGSLNRPILLQLPVLDPSINKEHLSFALRTLYNQNQCPDQWVGAVLSAAALLGLPQLFQRCVSGMLAGISAWTVCDFHRVSCKYKLTSLQGACERWLELFLVSDLWGHIHLKDLPFDLLLKTLRCPRLFVVSEYSLLKTVLYWIYLQLNPSEQTILTHNTVISFFCRAAGVFLEQPQGRMYAPLFEHLRLHGITERQHVEEMQMIGVFPWPWLLSSLTDHYRSIHSGGDMHLTDFSKQAVRFGLIVDGEPPHCTRAVDLYGFNFLLRASRLGESDSFCFSMERLRHWDLVLADGWRLTQPFCMRADRSVCYQISVQSCVCGEWREHSSGAVRHVFGLSKRYCRSEVFKVDGLSTPILVTFALAFPSP